MLLTDCAWTVAAVPRTATLLSTILPRTKPTTPSPRISRRPNFIPTRPFPLLTHPSGVVSPAGPPLLQGFSCSANQPLLRSSLSSKPLQLHHYHDPAHREAMCTMSL